jgi:periplasmic protein TonB
MQAESRVAMKLIKIDLSKGKVLLSDARTKLKEAVGPTRQRFYLGIIMQIRLFSLLAAGVLAGCASSGNDSVRPASSTRAAPAERTTVLGDLFGGTSSASSLDGYKRDLAQHISQTNAAKVYPGRPQALLRSVIVVKYTVDAHGNLTRTDIVRSNHDSETEGTALATLRKSAPFPKPASHLLRHGRLEITETWLFNNDGRFQLRTIAQPQMDS